MSKAIQQLLILSLIAISFNGYGQVLSLEQVLQKVVDHYPSIKSAAFQVARAQQENIKVETQLSWLLRSNVGYNRDTTYFGTATDKYNAGGSLNRNLDNGGSLGFNASLYRENAADAFGPTFPNPYNKLRFDVNYRHKFEKGANNPKYKEGLESAHISKIFALVDKLGLYDQLASQVIELYMSAATTQARISNIENTISRTHRLKNYIEEEFKLGLNEEKDILQVNARLSINRADKKSLQVSWQRQLISLNRLMGRPWQQSLSPELNLKDVSLPLFNEVYPLSQAYSSDLKRAEAQLLLADSAIRLSRDKRKDDLDLVFFVGNEVNQGDTQFGGLKESEVIGGLSIEFNRGLDKSGYDAELRQAHYERGIALQNKKQVLEDLQYNISSLIAEIQASDLALSAFKESVNAEQKKLDEARQRYRDGRIETDRIIDFESQLAVAELSMDLQAIELKRRYYLLNLLKGSVWKNIKLPDFSFNKTGLNGLNEFSKGEL